MSNFNSQGKREGINLQTLKAIIDKDQEKEFKLLFKDFSNWDYFVVKFSIPVSSQEVNITEGKILSLVQYNSNSGVLNQFCTNSEYSNSNFVEEENLIHYILKCRAIKILKLAIWTKPEMRNVKDISKSANLIHTFFSADFIGKNTKDAYHYDTSLSNYGSVGHNKPYCEILSYLVNDIKVNFSQDKEGNTEFHKWLNHSCVKCLNNLSNALSGSKQKNYFQLKNQLGLNPLHLSVINGNYDGFISLYKNLKYDLNQLTTDRNNLYHLCAIGGNKKLLNEIYSIKGNSDINKFNAQNQSAFYLACFNENFTIANFLLEKGSYVSKADISLLNQVSYL